MKNQFQEKIDMVDRMMKSWNDDPTITEHYKTYYRNSRLLESICPKFHEKPKKVYIPPEKVTTIKTNHKTHTTTKSIKDRDAFCLIIPSCLERCTPENGCDTCKHDFLKHNK